MGSNEEIAEEITFQLVYKGAGTYLAPKNYVLNGEKSKSTYADGCVP